MKECCIFGNGSSLKDFDFRKIDRKKMISLAQEWRLDIGKK